MRIAFYGSSLLSSDWKGAATYYRGLLRDLAARGHAITFYEPDAYDRQAHRDIDPPGWAAVRVYPATRDAMRGVVAEAAGADVVIKASGVGVFDDELLEGVVAAARADAIRIFWDVDAPATLADLAFLGNRLPDREARVERFFLDAAARLPQRAFLIGGSGWADKAIRRTCATSATSTRASTTPSTRRRSPCSTSPATAWRRSATRRRPACSRRQAPPPAPGSPPSTPMRIAARRWTRSCARRARASTQRASAHGAPP